MESTGSPQRVFVAGATGVIGRALVPLLLRAGDAVALCEAVERARPDVVIHQLTDLPDRLTPEERPAALERNARMRIAGTNNLLVAAVAAGVGRVIAQSIAFLYAPGPLPHGDDAPLQPGPSTETVHMQ